MAKETESNSRQKDRGTFDDRTRRSMVLLEMAVAIAQQDPNGAAELAKVCLNYGISFGLQDVLIAIQQQSFDLAQDVFLAALARLRTAGMVDPNELLILYAYLYTPGQIKGANTTDSKNLASIAVSRNKTKIAAAAGVNPDLSKQFLNLAADLLINSPAPSTTDNPQQTARAQISVIQSLLPKMMVDAPDRVGDVQKRMQQLEVDAQFSPTPTQPTTRAPAPIAGEDAQQYRDRRTDFAEEQAKKETDPLKRDIRFAEAALGTSELAYDRGLSLAGYIKDGTLRSNLANWICYRASVYFARKNDFEKVYELGQKNDDKLQRAASLVLGAQGLAKAKDVERASEWLHEARVLVKNSDSTDGWASVAFGAVSTYGQFDKGLARETLLDVVSTINHSTDTSFKDDKAPLIKHFSGLTASDFTSGTTGFGIQAAMSTFKKDQFEDILLIINSITIPEVRGTAIIAFCRANFGQKAQTK
jgi:hypothetical protein